MGTSGALCRLNGECVR